MLDIRYVENIKSGHRNTLTVLGNKARGIKVGDELHVIYKPHKAKSDMCDNCLTRCVNKPEMVTRCPRYTNIFGVTTVTKLEEVDLLHIDPHERDYWARGDGFIDFQHADDWYMSRYGEEWCFRPVVVVTWDRGPIAKKWKV